MKGKILLVTGLAVGYVLGTRAGHERYEQIKKAASDFWNSPRVQRQVGQAEDFVKDKAPEVVEFLADGAKKVAGQVSNKKSSPAKTTAAKSTTASRSRKPSTSA